MAARGGPFPRLTLPPNRSTLPEHSMPFARILSTVIPMRTTDIKVMHLPWETDVYTYRFMLHKDRDSQREVTTVALPDDHASDPFRAVGSVAQEMQRMHVKHGEKAFLRVFTISAFKEAYSKAIQSINPWVERADAAKADAAATQEAAVVAKSAILVTNAVKALVIEQNKAQDAEDAPATDQPAGEPATRSRQRAKPKGRRAVPA